MKLILFIFLLLGFLALFYSMYTGNALEQFYRKTKNTLDKSSRENVLLMRKALIERQEKNPFWLRIEKSLYYTGLKRRYPWLTGIYLVFGLLLFLGTTIILLLPWGLLRAIGGCGIALAVIFLVQIILRRRERILIGQSLMSFLDFLGNYSITAGEITWIFERIAPYMKAPVKAALEECVLEAKMTGDVNMALLSMADRVDHPQFREIIRNLEIGIRYLADFKSLVETCKGSLREYEKSLREEKSMAMEGFVNVGLLLGMSLLSLVFVDRLIDQSIWHILFFTWVGRCSLGFIVFLLTLFGIQVGTIEK